MNTRIAIIILNYRKPALTTACLKSLDGELTPGLDSAVVVENGSGDDSYAQLTAAIAQNGWENWARVVTCEPNRGFAGGNNVGLRAIEARYYMLLNNDTVVRPGVVRELLRVLNERPEVGIIGPSMENGAGDWTPSCHRETRPLTEFVRTAKTGPITKLFSSYQTSTKPPASPTPAGWLGFACVLIRREVFDQVGLLDEGFYLYFDDNDFCRRARDAGWRLLYWPAARIVHYVGETNKIGQFEQTLARRPKYFYESRSRYFAKFFGVRGLWLANVCWLCGRAISAPREILTGRRRCTCSHEARDIWINCFSPLKTRSQSASGPPAAADKDSVTAGTSLE